MSESEYAAWTLMHGSKINHMMFSFENIKLLDFLQKLDVIETPFLIRSEKIYYDDVSGGFLEFVERKN